MGLYSNAAAAPADPQGLITIASAHPVKQTLDRLVHIVESKGLTVFCRIDHAANAVGAGLPLRPTEVLIFGNAKGGTPLMQAAQTLGIDLPLKALAWEDVAGKTWLSYNDPVWLAARHHIGDQGALQATALRDGLAAMTQGAAMA
jgi:uncharacterized protein (DUF302 family)